MQIAGWRLIPIAGCGTLRQSWKLWGYGMAQRGGTVLSTIKVGAFHSPLIRSGQSDAALLLWEANLPVHHSLLKKEGALVINSEDCQTGRCIDATGLARQMDNAVLANLILLGFAVREGALFCSAEECEEAIRKLAPAKFLKQNLAAFHRGCAGGDNL